MSQLGASSFKDGRARWAVPVNPGSCQTERRTLADSSGVITAGGSSWRCGPTVVAKAKALGNAASLFAKPYNFAMSLRGAIKVAIPITVTIAGWFLTPIIKAKMDGTPLNGLPGILTYWKHVVTAPTPLWAVFLVVALAVSGGLIALKMRKKSKPHLAIVVLPTPEPRWSIGANKKIPFMSLHFHARFATTEEHPIEIVNGYLKGTKSAAFLSLNIVVAGRHDPSLQVHLAVRPILAQPGEKVTGRVVLIDQYGNKHLTERITFADNPLPPEVFGVGRSAVSCFICGDVISMEDLHPSASFAAHKRCVR